MISFIPGGICLCKTCSFDFSLQIFLEGVFYIHKQLEPFFRFFILCIAHTHPLEIHTLTDIWKCSEGPGGRMVWGLWSSLLNVKKCHTQKHERPTLWLDYATDALMLTCAMFHFSKQLSITSDDIEKQLLTSTSQLVCCILESHAALICCCSKHLKPPQTPWESIFTGYMYSAWLHCVVIVSKRIESLLKMGES